MSDYTRDEIVVRKVENKNLFEAFFNATNDIVTGISPDDAIRRLRERYGSTGKEVITKLNHGENW